MACPSVTCGNKLQKENITRQNPATYITDDTLRDTERRSFVFVFPRLRDQPATHKRNNSPSLKENSPEVLEKY